MTTREHVHAALTARMAGDHATTFRIIKRSRETEAPITFGHVVAAERGRRSLLKRIQGGAARARLRERLAR